MSEFNNWNVSYGLIKSFENALEGHRKIEKFKRVQDIVFHITLWDYSEIKVLLLDKYTLGIAAVLDVLKEFHDIDHIVSGANWNGYTKEAKQYGWDNDIGIFVMGEFLGALNWQNPIKYHKKDRDGNPVYQYCAA
jgi:hypothetical protein